LIKWKLNLIKKRQAKMACIALGETCATTEITIMIVSRYKNFNGLYFVIKYIKMESLVIVNENVMVNE